jgi:hypothetical protein
MGWMPYVVARGGVFSSIQDLTQAQRFDSLKRWMRGETQMEKLWESTAPGVSPAVHHIQEHWLGSPDTTGTKVGAPTTRVGWPFTGWWHWSGDAHEILRQTLVAAYRVSLGIPDNATNWQTLPNATRDWPISFLWSCGAPHFQGFVSWDEHSGGNDGHVTVIFSTPPPDSAYKDPDPSAPPVVIPNVYDGVEEDDPPFTYQGTKRMAIIGHAEERLRDYLAVTKGGVTKYYPTVNDFLSTITNNGQRNALRSYINNGFNGSAFGYAIKIISVWAAEEDVITRMAV